jgi:hypothetical protein
MREAGIKDEDLQKGVGRTFGFAFVFSLVIALNLAFFLGPSAGAAWGATAGALAGAGWAAASLAIVFLFERRSWTLILIDGGYTAIAYTLQGTIIGAWPG